MSIWFVILMTMYGRVTYHMYGRVTCSNGLAGQMAVRLARRLEKTTYKLEAHHSHLHYTHQAITNCWLPKSLRFKAPSQHSIFERIMERASNHCMRARITICHDQIKNLKISIRETKTNLTQLMIFLNSKIHKLFPSIRTLMKDIPRNLIT